MRVLERVIGANYWTPLGWVAEMNGLEKSSDVDAKIAEVKEAVRLLTKVRVGVGW